MGRQILVIDDEQSVRDAFQLALEQTGYTVTTAASGEEGLTRVQEQCFDLIFLDLRMPGMSGVDTLRHVKQICPATPVYVITAFYQSYFEPLKQLEADGIHFQLARKPLASADIREIARGVLEGPEARQHD